MKNSELIEFLKTQPFTRTQAYNLIIADLFEAVTEDELTSKTGQDLLRYFEYKIAETLLPVIEKLKS